MSTETMEFRLRAIMDVNDVVSNVGTIQKSFNKLKLPDKIGDNLNKKVSEFYKEYEKYQKKTAEGIKTQGDYNQVEKSLNRMKTLYQEIGKEAKKATKLDIDSLIDLGTGDFKRISDEISKMVQQINNVKIDPKQLTRPFQEIKRATQNKKIVGDNGLLNQIIGHINEGEIDKAKNKLKELQNYAQKVSPRTVLTTNKETGKKEEIRAPGTMDVAKYETLTNAINLIATAFDKADSEAAPFITQLDKLQKELQETKNAANQDLLGDVSKFNEESKNVEKVTDSLKRMHEEEFNFNRQAQDIDRQIQSYFGLSQMIRKVGDIAKDAFQTVKELDKAMTETAVVTNFSVGDMWTMLPTYTEQANQLGSTIKDVYEAATLYYQQGLNNNQAMALANETLKMARIAGLEAADATDMMTAALRGFNMEINQVSAQKINDVYSELAAITASNTQEIGSAMERTASIANSANMQFETTSAFLAQMIETTREAPENLGTAMKTIVARFQEMKQDPTKLVDSEGVAMDANKVDKALKSIGVQLTNTKGEFRDLDDVFLEIASKWDSLSQGQQRYIATIAAGSRQQSRFIAMMSNYERTMELVDAANNSAGASQRQFEKTLDSMEAKLNQLKNAWNQFAMGLANNQIIKFTIDRLTDAFTVINKLIDLLGNLPPSPFEGITKSALTLAATLGGLNFGKKFARGGVMAGVGWWKGEGTLTENFKSGWGAGVSNKKVEEKDFQKQAQESLLKKYNSKLVNNEARLKVPVSAEAYLQKIDASKLDSRIKQKIEDELDDGPITVDKQVKINNIIKQDANYTKDLDITDDLVQSEEGIDNFGNKFDGLTGKITNAGMALQQFGSAMKSPLGDVLSTVGSLMVGLGTSLEATAASFNKNIALGMTDAGVKTADATATTLLGNAQLATAAKAQILGKAMWMSLGPYALIAAAIFALIAAYKFLDSVIVTNKEKLEAASDAAAAAGDAYDSVKQETSELKDSIEKIKETDSAFDGLVAGTAEFNDQLIKANEQILALIDKYPMLMEGNFVTTDRNGLMHISEEGFEKILDYQKKIQAQASAMNLIQTADLTAEENRQKAEQLRKPSYVSPEEYEKNQREAEMLEKRADAEVDLARKNAIRTALSEEELKNVDALTSVYAGLYEQKRKAAEIDADNLDSDEIRQKYADYHGYTYNKSDKKITDIEGNEIDYKDEAIKDEVIEQTVILDFQANAASLEKVLDQLDNKFSESFGVNDFITDLMSLNVETDADVIKDILTDNSNLEKFVNTLSKEEIAAMLQVSVDSITDANFDSYKDKLVDLFTDNAINIIDAQKDVYADLGTLVARAQGKSLESFQSNSENQQAIIDNLQNLSIEQANAMAGIGAELEKVGADSVNTYINKVSDLYTKGEVGTAAAEEVNAILSESDLTSAIGRLEAYNELTQSTTKEVKGLGESLLKSTDSANLLGEAFDEFVAGDLAKIEEKMDDFTNSLGEIDAAGILKASEMSGQLSSLLDVSSVSASGLAMALQGIEDGKYSIGAVNSTVLQLLSSLNRLSDVALEAHNIIEKFDAGIDTGEGEDFVQKNAEAAIEYYKNGEFGNEQLQNYIKLAAGTERWNKALRKNGGDLQKTEKQLMKYVKTFKDGFGPVWDQMVQGKALNGNALSKNINKAFEKGNISKSLKKQFEKVDFFYDNEGYLSLDIGNLSTDELETYFKEIYGVSDEYAKLLLQDLKNYDATVSSKLAKNDFNKLINSKDFKETHQSAINKDKSIITDADIMTYAEASGQSYKKAKKEIKSKGNFKVLDLIDNKTGERKELKGGLLETVSKEIYGTESKDLLKQKDYINKEGEFDLSKMVAEGTARGLDQNQALQAVWEGYKSLSPEEQANQKFLYNGREINLADYSNWDELPTAIEELQETSKWVDIGEAIAEGIINFLSGKPEDKSDKNQEPKKPDTQSSTKEASESGNPKKNKTGLEAEEGAKSGAITDKKTVSAMFLDWIKGQIENSDTTAHWKENSVSKTDKQFTEKPTEVQTSNDTISNETNDNYTEATTNLNTSATNLTESATAQKEAADGLKDAAAELKPQKEGNSNNVTPQTANSANGESIDKTSTVSIQIPEYDKLVTTKQLIESIPTEKTSKITIAQNYETTGTEANVDNKTASISYTLNDNDQAKPTPQTTSVIYTLKDKDQAKPKPKDADVNYKWGSQEDPRNRDITLWATIKDKKSGKIVSLTAAQGKNNSIPNVQAPVFGSAARGRYGTIGPKDKGGLTLTGEKGFEIAWLPSENRSMVLGVGGPQMVNLPNDAVVYTHEQSKEIVKRKGIPAGSHSDDARTGRKKDTGGSNDSGGGGKKGGGNNKKKKQEEENAKKAKKINNWWENIARKTEQLQRTADKNQKIWEKYLKKLQATLKKTGTEGQGNAFIKKLNKVIDLNRQQANKASERLNKLDKGNSKLSISYKKGKKPKKESVNVSKYIKIDKESGEYIIDDKALNKDFKKGNKRKAINEALNKELDENISKRNNAEDKIAAAQEALENFSEELYQTFFAWENELTTIWELTKQIEGITGKTSRLESFYNLLNAQISSGMEVASKEMNQSIADTFRKQMDFQVKEIQTRGKLIEEQRADILSLLSTKDEQTTLNSVNKKLKENLSETEKSGYKEYAEELKNQINAIKKAQEYLNITKYTDGTIDVDFNQQKLEKDKLNGEISIELYNSIKEYTEKLTDANSELNSSLTELTDNITNLYTSLEDLRKNYADAAEDLVSDLESSNSKQINNLKQISSNLSDALKKLTDEVRKNLDKRRQEEDNAKTEQDINRKQQRLAALRADTSGGHQVEIAQLEKEIVDAQESYQRTLEDQLLDRIQQQADEAAEQRERQIALQEAINTSVNNIAQVNAWLTALRSGNLTDEQRQAILDEIRQVMYNSRGYDQKTIPGQEQVAREVEAVISGIDNFSENEASILNAINTAQSDVAAIKTSIEKIEKLVPKTSNNNNNTNDEEAKRKKEKESQYQASLAAAQKEYKEKKVVSTDTFKEIKEKGNAAGYGARKYIEDLAENTNWDTAIRTADKAKYSLHRMLLTWENNPDFLNAFERVFGKIKLLQIRAEAKAKNYKEYATGGLAKHTGPAWLDGTPSKPELVLNAQDTKNLIALKDVLSHIMHSSNSTENTYGDTTFEININVDKLTSDYDVDKVAERVKKIIVQDSGYRNVTAVRKFR